MGLDMYLYKKHYVKNWDWMADHEKHTISVKKGKKKLDHIKPDRICYVMEQVMEWRKFNALHKWFVDNVQEGVDDCKECFVVLYHDELYSDFCVNVISSYLFVLNK